MVNVLDFIIAANLTKEPRRTLLVELGMLYLYEGPSLLSTQAVELPDRFVHAVQVYAATTKARLDHAP